MRDRLGAQTSTPPTSRRRNGLVWATLAVLAGAGVLAVRRAVVAPATRYRLERVDRGAIRNEVAAPGTVSAAMTRDLSRMQVSATVREADLTRVAVGDAATLCCPACPNCVSPGTVSSVGPNEVLVEADNQGHELRLGMATTVSIEVAHRDGVLRLPLGALHFVPPGTEPTTKTDPHEGRVFVLDHGRPRALHVTIGLEDLRHAELVAGPLREGDAVIVDETR
jgi:HlyD family secretion protein